MPSKMRLERIADRIRQDLSAMILLRVQDPRLAGISITDVRVDRELEYADVYVSAVEGSERAKEVIEGLKHAGGFLRHELAQQVELRSFPRLRFHWDPTPENADHIETILAGLRSEQALSGEDESSSEQELETDEDEESDQELETDEEEDAEEEPEMDEDE